MPIETQQTVMVPVEQLRQMEANAAQLQQLVSQRELDASTASLKASAASGQLESLARQHRQELEQERARAGNVAKRAELAQALSQQQLAPGAASQLTELWSGSLHADPSPTGYSVRTAGYQEVGAFVSEQLSRPEYAHFKVSGSQPAAPATSGNPAAQPAQPAQPPAPQNYGEAILQRAAAAKAAREAAAPSHPLSDMSKGFGLGRGSATNSFAAMVKALSLK
jgi:hypothetical protein